MTTNARPRNETVAETGPGIPDDAVLDGEIGPGELGGHDADALLGALRQAGWAPDDSAEASADAEAETEAHPS